MGLVPTNAVKYKEQNLAPALLIKKAFTLIVFS